GPFETRGGAITTMTAIINEDAPEAPTAGALGPVIAALLPREPGDRPGARAGPRVIANVLPQLPHRPPGAPTRDRRSAPAASAPPAASASPGAVSPASVSPRVVPPGAVPPAPASLGAVRPRTPQPGENALAYQPTVIKPPDSPAAGTGPPGGVQESVAPTAPT